MRAALYYAQRGIVQPTIRSAITASLATAIKWRHPLNGGQGDSTWHAVERSAILRTLDAEGIAVLPERLSVQLAEMNRFLSDRPLVLHSGERVDRQRVPSGCTMADYPLETVLNCPSCSRPGEFRFLDSHGDAVSWLSTHDLDPSRVVDVSRIGATRGP